MREDENMTNEISEELTKEQGKEQIRLFENDILAGLLAASDARQESQKIEIRRNGIKYFTFSVRPLTEAEYQACRKKHTRYVKNKQLGVKMPEETNTVKYRASLIYEATVDEDKKLLWDNKALWKKLSDRGQEVITATDVIDYALLAGEKARVVEVIDSISGFDEEEAVEETVKN